MSKGRPTQALPSRTRSSSAAILCPHRAQGWIASALHNTDRCDEPEPYLLQAADRLDEERAPHQRRHLPGKAGYGLCLIRQRRESEGKRNCQKVIAQAERRGDDEFAEATRRTLTRILEERP